MTWTCSRQVRRRCRGIFCEVQFGIKNSKGVQTDTPVFTQELARCFTCRSFFCYSLMLCSSQCLFHGFSAAHRHRSRPSRDHTHYSADHLPVHHGEVEAPYKRMKRRCRSYQVSTPRSSPSPRPSLQRRSCRRRSLFSVEPSQVCLLKAASPLRMLLIQSPS